MSKELREKSDDNVYINRKYSYQLENTKGSIKRNQIEAMQQISIIIEIQN